MVRLLITQHNYLHIKFHPPLASQFITIKNNKLFASAPLNHEMMSPGPELKVAVQCRLKSDSTVTQTTTKVFNISIVDRNDNLIKVQDKVTNLTLNSPYFQKVGVFETQNMSLLFSLVN